MVHGSARWIGVGFMRMQVSEIAKFAAVVYMAGYLVRRNEEIKTHLSGFFKTDGVISDYKCVAVKRA